MRRQVIAVTTPRRPGTPEDTVGGFDLRIVVQRSCGDDHDGAAAALPR